MDALFSITCLSISTRTRSSSPFPSSFSKPFFTRNSTTVSLFRATSNAVRELAEDDVLRIFIKERHLNGDFISKTSDKFWLGEILNFVDFDDGELADYPQQSEQVLESNDDGGFLKLSRTLEWVSGDNSAPMNKKARAKDDRDRRKKLNLLRYEALKRELMFLSVVIGTACTGYCLVALSIEAAISYSIGVLFSCLYLQLLCQHADNLSKETIPSIFMQKKSKKIGIRSEDLRDSFERSIKGSGIALSSPRLVIPAVIYGLWALSDHYFSSGIFEFQIVPAMFGMFVYKAAALVQVYRDNEDLRLIFPENMESSSD